MAPDLGRIPLADIKRLVREQFFALQLDQKQAVKTLPAMVPDAAQSASLLNEVQAIVDAAGAPTPETTQRLQAIASLLGEGLPPAKIAAPPRPVPAKAEPDRKPVPAAE